MLEQPGIKIPYKTAQGDGHALKNKRISHGFMSFTDQNGRFRNMSWFPMNKSFSKVQETMFF
ncbi:hypothetical protein CW304_17515 [Bacillus sp. UFRGS-B20]|nr:hypothetical protein CW304_17515 [Bacillus sp. UFRGS-B20]